MRPLRATADRPARLGGARVWLLERQNAMDSLDVASRLLGESIVRDANGRPRRANGDVSIAHAGDAWVMAAVERGRVGIDIEPLRERPNALQIARAQFPAREADALEVLPPPRRSATFLRLWCAREAVLKALGTGMEAGFGAVEFALTAHGLRCDTWRVREFRWRGFVGAIALSRGAGSA